MLTEEDFTEAERAIKAIHDKCMKSKFYALSLTGDEKTLYCFVKKVLAQSRRDFLTEVETTESVDAQDKEFEPYYKPMQLKHY